MENTRIILLNPFDAYAGAQRVASRLVPALNSLGYKCDIMLGFGNSGFVSDLDPKWVFCKTDEIRKRKFLYPFWVAILNFWILIFLMRNRSLLIWCNTIYALPSVVISLIFAPHRIIIHVHENNFLNIFRWTLQFASRMGAQIIAVSEYHAIKLGIASVNILPNSVGDEPPLRSGHRNNLLFVGSAQPMKGLSLFKEIVGELRHLGGMEASPVAYLAGLTRDTSQDVLTDLEAVGVKVVFGETRPDVIFAQGWLYLQLTDPVLWDETFSLVTAEAVWHLVPVGAAGSAVVNEVAAGAIAFNFADRNARSIAEAILELQGDPDTYAMLVAGCVERRRDYAQDIYIQRVAALLRDMRANAR